MALSLNEMTRWFQTHVFPRVVIRTLTGDSASDPTAPTVTSGSGIPTHTEPNGSQYLRTDGVGTSTLFLRVSSAWVAVGNTGLSGTTVFLSTEQTGTGALQNVAHGFGTTPVLAFAIPSILSNGLANGFNVNYGAHDSTNVKVTVNTGEKYKVVAFK